MRKFIAKRPILYLAHLYEIGEELPTANPDMAEAWIKAGSAAWEEAEADSAGRLPKAEAVTAQPGVPGLSSSGNPEDLVGRVPDRTGRKPVKPRRKAKK